MLGVKVAASTVWEILKEAGIDPAPDRNATTWSTFLCSQTEVILACDFLETVTRDQHGPAANLMPRQACGPG